MALDLFNILVRVEIGIERNMTSLFSTETSEVIDCDPQEITDEFLRQNKLILLPTVRLKQLQNEFIKAYIPDYIQPYFAERDFVSVVEDSHGIWDWAFFLRANAIILTIEWCRQNNIEYQYNFGWYNPLGYMFPPEFQRYMASKLNMPV